MRIRSKVTVALAVLAPAIVSACNDSSFSGNSPQNAASNTSGSTPKGSANDTFAPGSGTSTPSSDCVRGDKVDIPWSGPTKECFDSGKTWNFGSNACLQIRTAKFECTWDNVLKWLDETKLTPTDKIKNGASDGRKLVSCAESADSNRLVVIWLEPPERGRIDCSSASSLQGNVITGCYTYYRDPSAQPAQPSGEDAKKAQVYGCMNSL